MRIEMEVVSGGGEGSGGSGNVPSTLTSFHSSSFARSTSFLAIDDKIQRRLRKCVSRSWISWAESWCMRLWEDDDAAAMRMRGGPPGGGGKAPSYGPSGRSRSNVRPSVCRIGDPIVATSSSSSSLSSDARRSDAAVVVVPPRHVWERLHPGGDDACRGNVLRWTSTDGEGECGVEVSRAIRTMSPFGRRGRGTTEARVQRQLGRRGSCPRTPRK